MLVSIPKARKTPRRRSGKKTRSTARNKEFNLPDYAKAIRAVGVEHCILSSDMGQPGNPLHPDGMLALMKGLREQGFSQADIDRMAKINPARVLGLN